MSRKDRQQQRAAAGALAALVLLGALLALIFGASPIAIAAAVLPWAWWTARRYGLAPAMALTLVAFLWSLTFVLVVTRALDVRMDVVMTAVFALAGLGGVGLILLRTTRIWTPRGWPPFIASLSGAMIWTGFLVASQLLPAFDRLSWVMRNDSLNNVIFARDVLRVQGITIGALQNPAPLPASIIAIFMDAGRSGVDSAALLGHDLAGLSLAWATLIALTCVLAGLTAATMARRAGGRVGHEILASTLGSLAILSWYATGSAMEYGFINTNVSLVVLLAVVLVALSSQLESTVRVVALAVGSTVMLAVWAPLAVVPLALLIHAVLRARRELLVLRRGPRVVVLLAILQLLVWGGGVTVVTLVSQRDALAGAGGIFRSAWWLVFLVSIAVVVLDRFKPAPDAGARGFELPAIVLAALAGITFLLYVSRRSPDIWTYYPVKFSWFVTLFLGVLLLGQLVGVLGARISLPFLRRTALGAVAAAVALLIAWVPDITPNLAMNPLDRLVRAQTVERVQQLHEQILANSDPQHPVLFWNDLEWGEADVDLWLISLKADTLMNTPLRLAAYSSYTDRSIEQLCNLVKLMGPNLTVMTRDAHLPAEARDQCSYLGNVAFSLR